MIRDLWKRILKKRKVEVQETDIESILTGCRKIAVVGISDKPHRDSYQVAAFMKAMGYRIFPVNPHVKTVLGEPCYPDLLAIPEPVDLVDIFRRPEAVEAIVDQAIAKGAKAVWMQLGIVNEKAARKAAAAGLQVVMDRCWKMEYQARFGSHPQTDQPVKRP
ncbi:MAG: CoA-binding protein [Calditrichaeota bacterium]|nr:MAG: CoA-binding protein [Calditrichota bacterium]